MTDKRCLQVPIRVEFAHRVYFTRGVFSRDNPLLSKVLAADDGAPVRVLPFVDAAVAAADACILDRITAYLSAPPCVLPAGEQAKNRRAALDEVYEEIARRGLCRHSYVLAIGGGALLDLVGFAAATAHRGIRLVRLPTTTLAQADGGVGVKNGINAFGKKNFIGTFAPPHAVIDDFDFLATLPPAEARAGYIEAVKVALVRDAAFFAEIEERAPQLFARDPGAVEWLIRRSAELHVTHIANSGDPFELGSARPLDFGHWAAHRLEALSDFLLGHGAAVAWGLALDVIYSRRRGFLDAASAERILRLVEALGLKHGIEKTPEGNLLAGLEEFREHLGGRLTITLLREIGEGFEVHDMDPNHVAAAAAELDARWR